MKDQELINLINITKDYVIGDVVTKVLKGIYLKVKRGEFIAITGRSGSGKSTLMNLIGLLDTPTNGSYILEEADVLKFKEDELSDLRNRKIGFVFQSFNLLPRSTVLENVILPGIYAGVDKKTREEKGRNLLLKLDLLEQESKRPNRLSGGQQQRVAIARALMNNPDLILADEPTGNLDIKSGQDVMRLLKKLNREGKTIILITHERDIAKHAKRVIELIDGKINSD